MATGTDSIRVYSSLRMKIIMGMIQIEQQALQLVWTGH